MSELPAIALAVRQPWAWAIIHSGKDIENRTSDAIAKGGMRPGRIAILASKGMTRDEYEGAAEFMRVQCGVVCPLAGDLLRGGIIGSVTVRSIISESSSPWFIEQRRGRGLVMVDALPCAFAPASGQLGYFKWKPAGDGPEPIAKWMRSTPAAEQFELS
jgi:hypothetical protein